MSEDTRTLLRKQMDRLCLNMGREANRMKGDDTLSTRLEVVKVVTGYLSMANREPDGAEGGDFDQWRNQLPGGNPGGGAPAGDDAGERDSDAESGEGEGGGEPDDSAEPPDSLPRAAE